MQQGWFILDSIIIPSLIFHENCLTEWPYLMMIFIHIIFFILIILPLIFLPLHHRCSSSPCVCRSVSCVSLRTSLCQPFNSSADTWTGLGRSRGHAPFPSSTTSGCRDSESSHVTVTWLPVLSCDGHMTLLPLSHAHSFHHVHSIETHSVLFRLQCVCVHVSFSLCIRRFSAFGDIFSEAVKRGLKAIQVWYMNEQRLGFAFVLCCWLWTMPTGSSVEA